jgi:FlaA1/EpsC-like NDP-sugar epimerase
VKIIPGVSELVEGKVNLSFIRDVAIEDLLRREPVELDSQAIAGTIEGRVVMVTGAGGSIGSELCRQLCHFAPARLLLVERAENALFEIHRELAKSFPGQLTEACLADLCDEARMARLLLEHRPEVVFHAAAHKHVPMMEQNPGEAVKNNVHGTRLLCDLSDAHGVSCLVMISTDKAVHPSSVMGASKRAAEIYVQALSQHSKTRFGIVRFGNVLGSAGSVVPIFKKQIAAGGPITVTHPDMQRYFMTIPEAAQLVLQAGTMGSGGEVFILDMGDPVKVMDLARDLVRLSGLKQEEIAFEFTGIRPGEKLSEELSTQAERADKTRHPKILVGRTSARDVAEVRRALDALLVVAQGGAGDAIREALSRLVTDCVWETASRGSSASSRALPAPAQGSTGSSASYDSLPASMLLAASSSPAAVSDERPSRVDIRG